MQYVFHSPSEIYTIGTGYFVRENGREKSSSAIEFHSV